jgi:hypothetical protein
MNNDVDATQNKAAAKNVLINNQYFKSNVTMRVDNTSEGGEGRTAGNVYAG